MGEQARRRKAFFEAHPYCAFCGGLTKATTVEHCPPRALFQNKQWPRGFEFPACTECNHGTSDEDALVAMLARMDPSKGPAADDSSTFGLMHRVNKRYPKIFEKMMPSPIEARRINRKLGITPLPGAVHQETGALKVPPEVHHSIFVFSRKLAKAIYYLESARIFPAEGTLLMHWFSNEQLVERGYYPVIEAMKSLAGDAQLLERTGKDLKFQFKYKISITTEKNIFILQSLFGKSFGFVVLGSTRPGLLETEMQALAERKENPNPFTILQSPKLGAFDQPGCEGSS